MTIKLIEDLLKVLENRPCLRCGHAKKDHTFSECLVCHSACLFKGGKLK